MAFETDIELIGSRYTTHRKKQFEEEVDRVATNADAMTENTLALGPMSSLEPPLPHRCTWGFQKNRRVAGGGESRRAEYAVTQIKSTVHNAKHSL